MVASSVSSGLLPRLGNLPGPSDRGAPPRLGQAPRPGPGVRVACAGYIPDARTTRPAREGARTACEATHRTRPGCGASRREVCTVVALLGLASPRDAEHRGVARDDRKDGPRCPPPLHPGP